MLIGTLSSVEYGLFDHELGSSARESLRLDGELCLVLSSGKRLYVSWADDPIQHCVGIKDVSFFGQSSALSYIATDDAMWLNLIGQSLALEWLTNDQQVLELRSSAGSVFVASREEDAWYCDTLTLSTSSPLD